MYAMLLYNIVSTHYTWIDTYLHLHTIISNVYDICVCTIHVCTNQSIHDRTCNGPFQVLLARDPSISTCVQYQWSESTHDAPGILEYRYAICTKQSSL